ncbi:Type II inositol 1,4,5-trisphosphate 5-phosphatase, partial [Spiromyces aspiralis]
QQHQQQQQQQQQPEESLADIRLEYDELTHEKTPGSVFEDFQEAPISFGPTFKFVVGSSVHDTKRRPAWTDRILWCTKRCAPDVEPWFKFTNRRYRSHPELTTSDHKPVSALFTLDTLVLSEAKYKKALSEFLRRVDEDENRLASTVSISKNELDFGQIDYQRPVIEVLTLTNSGDFAVSFEFIRKPGESRLFAPWLRVIPQQGRIAPRSELKLNFIASTRAARLEGAMMDGTVHDWAILQLENQKLIFITVTGESRPS